LVKDFSNFCTLLFVWYMHNWCRMQHAILHMKYCVYVYPVSLAELCIVVISICVCVCVFVCAKYNTGLPKEPRAAYQGEQKHAMYFTNKQYIPCYPCLWNYLVLYHVHTSLFSWHIRWFYLISFDFLLSSAIKYAKIFA
jgi:hypothetical protein